MKRWLVFIAVMLVLTLISIIVDKALGLHSGFLQTTEMRLHDLVTALQGAFIAWYILRMS